MIYSYLNLTVVGSPPIGLERAAAVRLKQCPVYDLGSDNPRNFATIEGAEPTKLTPTGEFTYFPFRYVKNIRSVLVLTGLRSRCFLKIANSMVSRVNVNCLETADFAIGTENSNESSVSVTWLLSINASSDRRRAP